MRIAILSWVSPHTQRVAEGLAARGHAVHLIAEKAVSYSGVTTHLIDESPAIPKTRMLKHVHAMRKLFRDIRPDVYNAHYLNYGGYRALALGFHPFVLTLWGSDILETPALSAAHRIKGMLALRGADAVVSNPSRAMLAAARALSGREAVPCAFHGADLAHFRFRAARSLRAVWNVGPGDFVFLSVRAMDPFYRTEAILRAFAAARRENPGVGVLALMTHGGNAAYGEQCRGLAAGLGIAAAVRFLPGVPYEQMPEVLSAADAVLSNPRSDAIPSTMIEAMACERPYVQPALPGMAELIDSGRNGFLVSDGDEGELTRTILSLRAMPDADRAALGAQARKTAEAQGDFAQALDVLEGVFSRVAGRAGVSRLRTLRNAAWRI